MYVHLDTRKIVVEESPSLTTRMVARPEGLGSRYVVASKGMDARVVHVEAWHVPLAAALIGITPNVEHLVDGTERVELEFVVAVTAVDEDLQVIFEEQQIVAGGHG